MSEKQQIIIYQTEDGRTKIDVRLENDTAWLSQMQMAELFDTTKQNIGIHIKNILEESEVSQATVKKIFIVQEEGNRMVERLIEHYSLDMIIAVGYRVKSLRGTQFRQWATNVLSEYIKKGFAMNDELLKQAGGGGYWKELLSRIRDIRSSEKVFYRQILDIYATSVDYSPQASETLAFFKIVQNKMHFAVHGHTAAEIQHQRADCSQPFMGLKAFAGQRPRKDEVTVAKNYLDEKELDYLNRITSMYLDFAEFQALEQKPMLMKDWIAKLDEFLKVNGRMILNNAGAISKQPADDKALAEYAKYKEMTVNESSEVEKHFLENIKSTQKRLEKKKQEAK
ncbi:toxin Fic [Alphaproteobacteria bacterium]|nr:toxin Fic [Alphaproteobacteria bacterium]